VRWSPVVKLGGELVEGFAAGSGCLVGRLCRRVPVAVPTEPLVALLPRMSGCVDGRAVVVEPVDRVVGIVSPRDISRAVSVADLLGTHLYPPRGADLNARSGSAPGMGASPPVPPGGQSR
jgi:hypothetical protein